MRRRRRAPDDVVVADGDGAVVIPAALLEEVVEAAAEQEKLEAWIMQKVENGAALPGLYPPNAENKARYEGAPHSAPAHAGADVTVQPPSK